MIRRCRPTRPDKVAASSGRYEWTEAALRRAAPGALAKRRPPKPLRLSDVEIDEPPNRARQVQHARARLDLIGRWDRRAWRRLRTKKRSRGPRRLADARLGHRCAARARAGVRRFPGHMPLMPRVASARLQRVLAVEVIEKVREGDGALAVRVLRAGDRDGCRSRRCRLMGMMRRRAMWRRALRRVRTEEGGLAMADLKAHLLGSDAKSVPRLGSEAGADKIGSRRRATPRPSWRSVAPPVECAACCVTAGPLLPRRHIRPACGPAADQMQTRSRPDAWKGWTERANQRVGI